MQVDYLKRGIFLGGKTISEGFFPLFFIISVQSSSQAIRNRVISPVSDAKAAGEGEEDNQGLVAAAG